MFSKWLMSTVALLVMDVRTGALHQVANVEPQQCYSCAGNSSSPCDQPSRWTTVVCPTALPFCATIASSPDFTSSLSCTAAVGSPCTLQYTSRQTYHVTCLCVGLLCNTPFSKKLQNELLNISYTDADRRNDSAKITEMFIKLSIFTNNSDSATYKGITDEISTGTEALLRNSSEPLSATSAPILSSTHSLDHRENKVPRADALKQEATAPSDDDEDETEGSGNYEERQPQPASAPAAPSSYLPAENTASSPYNTFFITLLFVPIVV